MTHKCYVWVATRKNNGPHPVFKIHSDLGGPVLVATSKDEVIARLKRYYDSGDVDFKPLEVVNFNDEQCAFGFTFRPLATMVEHWFYICRMTLYDEDTPS